MASYTTQLQQLYVAYFNRPADPIGLAFWQSNVTAAVTGGRTVAQALATVSSAFASSAEYTTAYAGKSSAQIIDQVYQNLFGRSAEVGGLTFWALALDQGTYTLANIVTIVSSNALTTDKVAFDSKVSAATAFTVALDTNAEILGYSGAAALAAAKAFISTVKDAATLATAIVPATLDATVAAVVSGGGAVGQTFVLTSGVDTFTGGTANDTFNAVATATTAVFGGLDNLDGGAGSDTLSVQDNNTAAGGTFSFGGATIKNIETAVVSTSGAFTSLDLTGLTGLTNATLTANGSANSTGIKLSATTNATISSATTGTNVSIASGGLALNLTGVGAATIDVGATGGGNNTTSATALTLKTGTGTVKAFGSALTTVTVNGGGTVTIDNTNASGATSGAGTTLTAVTLNADAGATLSGTALTAVTLSGQGAGGAAQTVTVTNSTAAHALTINAAGTGYTSAGAKWATVVNDTVATALTVNTSVKSAVDASGSTAVKAVTLTGAGALDLAAMPAVTLSIDGSAATGALTLNSLQATTVTVKTGSGDDTFTENATTKTTIDTGAGNDSLTVGAVLATGSSITLGLGNDKLLGAAAAAPVVSTTTVLDGGDGTDTVSADLINAGNASMFKNFENLSLNSATGLDLALLTGSTITALTVDNASSTATYQNVSATGLTDTFVGVNAVTNTLSLLGVSGTADAFTVTFNATNTGATPTSANVGLGTLAIAGIETVNVVSGGTKAWNSLALTDANARTLTITGASNADVTFVTAFGTAGSTGLSSIDGSAATGKLSITLANTGIASGGLTVKGGTAADTFITTTTASTLTGGAGADTFNVAATVAASTSAPVITSIADATAGDIIATAQKGTETFVTTKVDVSTATALFGGTVNALDLASTGDGSTNGIHKWFQYGGNTYIIQDTSVTTTFATTDNVIKLTGLIDLSGATFTQNVATASTITLI